MINITRWGNSLGPSLLRNIFHKPTSKKQSKKAKNKTPRCSSKSSSLLFWEKMWGMICSNDIYTSIENCLASLLVLMLTSANIDWTGVPSTSALINWPSMITKPWYWRPSFTIKALMMAERWFDINGCEIPNSSFNFFFNDISSYMILVVFQNLNHKGKILPYKKRVKKAYKKL